MAMVMAMMVIISGRCNTALNQTASSGRLNTQCMASCPVLGLFISSDSCGLCRKQSHIQFFGQKWAPKSQPSTVQLKGIATNATSLWRYSSSGALSICLEELRWGAQRSNVMDYFCQADCLMILATFLPRWPSITTTCWTTAPSGTPRSRFSYSYFNQFSGKYKKRRLGFQLFDSLCKFQLWDSMERRWSGQCT